MKKRVKLRFDRKLVLNQWALGLFGASTFEELADGLKDPSLEKTDSENVSLYCRILGTKVNGESGLNEDILLGYDRNIYRHTCAISEKRPEPIRWKYFQYLSLLFTEIYLDRYFRSPEKLLEELSEQVTRFNQDKDKADRIEPYVFDDLRKLAYWNATGSGKTLLMHVNILQYRHYLDKTGNHHELNRIILLTPNEGLSNQHLEEFQLSGMDAEKFDKDGGRGLFSGKWIEIIDIHKLREESGDKTIAVDAFEDNNLVLVDEGHRGSSGTEWKDKRDRLSERGFAFEYSATFGQAVKAANNAELEQEYAKCILFDYSYRFFYEDGFGKDYRILNLEEGEFKNKQFKSLYMTACLLGFYQQQRLFNDNKKTFHAYLLEKPLWVFVGGSVNAVRTENKRKVSDVVEVLLFLAEFVHDREASIQHIERILSGHTGLRNTQGHDLFANAFHYLIRNAGTPEELFIDILKTLFNSSSGGALHVENLKGTDGEIALCLGNSEPFGLINVGDASSLCKLCEEQPEFVVGDHEFSGSYFSELSKENSSINLLIGSKKFTEGWNSWRVSTMGLMNIGRTEGSEIIQLFGRGVRLKGYDWTLKRSGELKGVGAPKPPMDMPILETLNIFGIRADYMRQFKEYLQEEGAPVNDNLVDFVLPVIKKVPAKLKTLALPQNLQPDGYRRFGAKPVLEPLEGDYFKLRNVVLDWYPRVQSAYSKGSAGTTAEIVQQEGKFERDHLAFLDFDKLFFDLEEFKNQLGWYNLNIPKESLSKLLIDGSWYTLYIPQDDMSFDDVASGHIFDRIRQWQEIASALLQKYAERLYSYRKKEWETPRLEYCVFDENDPNFEFPEADGEKGYIFTLDEIDPFLDDLKKIKQAIIDENLKDADFPHLDLKVFHWDCNLYTPLICISSKISIQVKPVALNRGEREFVEDLRKFYNDNAGFFEGKELYLLRNRSKKGIGFFEEGGFYPDFILWLIDGKKQYITFIDPKGIRNLRGQLDPKISFSDKIKELESRLKEPDMVLNSFIVSNTKYVEVKHWGGTQDELNDLHVLFEPDDKNGYIKKLFDMIVK